MATATRSHVSQFGAPSPCKPGAAGSRKGSPDEFNCPQVSSSLGLNYACLAIESIDPEGYVQQEGKAGRRPATQQNPGFKRCRRKGALQGSDVGTIASRAGGDNDQLERQTIRLDFGGTETQTISASNCTKSYSALTRPPPTLKFGMYAGRVKANPLKYLATVLRSKLEPHYEACNLLEVATEIHDEAKNKHNTTLRRIYDVVNVLEAAGLLERCNGRSLKRSLRNGSPNKFATISNTVAGSPSAAECSQSAVDCGPDFMECHDKQIDIYSRNRAIFPAKKPNPLEMKSKRGSRIRWLGCGSQYEQQYHRQTLGRLTREKIAAVQRISEKQREFEYLQEELRLTTELIKHNQSQVYQSDGFESNLDPYTPPPEDLSWSYLNFEDCSPTSAETECSHESLEFQAVLAATTANESSVMCGSWSSMRREFHSALNSPSIVTEVDENYNCNQPASEVGVNILETAEQYQSYNLPRTISGIAKRGLHCPFLILQNKNTTNVDIDQVASSETSEVCIVLDDEYKLLDYRELLSSMFPE